MVISQYFERFRAEQIEDSASVDCSHKAALVIEPMRVALFRNAIADKRKAGGAERNQLVGIDRNVTRVHASESGIRGAILHEIPGHPVVFAAGQALDGFAEIAAQRGCSTFSG